MSARIWKDGCLEHHETPGDVGGNAHTVPSTRSRKPEFRLSNQTKGLARSRGTRSRVSHRHLTASVHTATSLTAHDMPAGQQTSLPTGGEGCLKNNHLDQDRPLNSFFINVQKKGKSGAQKTQQKPTGFHGGSTC